MRTIQLWPEGKSVSFEGNYPDFLVQEGEVGSSTIVETFQADPTLAWRIEIELLAEHLLRDDVLCCDSALVEALLKAGFDGFSIDDIENEIKAAGEWTIDECREYLKEMGGDVPDVDDDADEDDILEEYRSAAQDCANDNPQEVYEWWRVSQSLCGELRQIGEPVIDNDYGYWWGRTCTGQSIIQDGTLQDVAALILNRRTKS